MELEFKLYMILTLLQVGKVTSECPATVYRDVKGFGPDCRYRCNCKNQQCDIVTGRCLDGCLPVWMGPSCQYRNLARLVTNTRQNPTTTGTTANARVAIDGNVTTCSRTGPNTAVPKYWEAEFSEHTYLVGFVIQINQADAGLFRGFMVEVGNGTNTLTTCYRHGENSDGKSIMDINCEQPVVGKIVRISLAQTEIADLVICEVEIYGGRLVSFNRPTSIESVLNWGGFWNSSYAVDGRAARSGEDQDTPTIRTCAATPYGQIGNKWLMVNLEHVYSIIGLSFYGLQFKGHFDNFVVKVGLNNSTLQTVFEDSPVAASATDYLPRSKNLTWPVNGVIAWVERPGTILIVCELEVFAECSMDKWGQYCNKTCGNCEENTCDVVTGICSGSCYPGWKPPQCNEACTEGKYGLNCSNTCGNCKNGETCHHITAICDKGCQPGWKTEFCNQSCDSGRYGDGCNNTCGNCLNNNVCTPINGSCPGGCAAGYFETQCKTPCTPGWYGPKCNTTCGYCDSLADCDKQTGKCSNGCLSGWLGSFCKDPCKDGLYGVYCTSSCGYCMNNEPCDKTNGNCRACAPGYQMNNCTENVSLTDSSKGAIAGGIIASLVVVAIVTVLVVMWKKRKSCISCKNAEANKRVNAEKNEPEASYYNLESSGNSCHQQLEFSTDVMTYESLLEADGQSRTETYECLQNQTNNASVSSKLLDGKQNVEPVYVNSK